MSFQSLQLAPALLTSLQALGFDNPTPIQADAIPAVLSGQDLLASAETGSGKTAAFLLPILHRLLSRETHGVPRALVLAPTRELAQQIVKHGEALAEHSPLKFVLLQGGANIGPQCERLASGVDVVVATPGRLLDHLIKGSLSLSAIETVVFDEADRLLDMGFKDEIQRIRRRLPAKRQSLLFSATIDSAIEELANVLLEQPVRINVAGTNRAATPITQQFFAVDEEKKQKLAAYLIGKNNWRQVLVFARTKQLVDEYVNEFILDGLPASALHGDKTQGHRNKALEQFKEGKIRVLVATDVAARGIDIPELEVVFNLELPYVAEDYIHRIGRTGRAGKAGLALSFVSVDEEWMLQELEVLLDERLTPQWVPGFEPDLNREPKNIKRNSNSARKSRDKKRILGQRAPKRR
ncbi:DEAD/DEAH box helicase [Pseudoalteromonas fenneropenaei]|uniref:DEAD/DEAH box helicase n=1 Tax=Pseudoalteromonas fenneropenaei TaxID=1737459 RepID=A0ABV7CH10_9GAMM